MSVPDPVSRVRRPASVAAARSAAQPVASGADSTPPVLRMGLDVGSTTIKLVLLPEHSSEALAGARPDPASVSPVSPVFAEYRRHNADVRGELTRLLGEVARAYPGAVVRGAVTGSAGLSLAALMGLPFVQEVIAETETVRVCDPQADVVIVHDAARALTPPEVTQRVVAAVRAGHEAVVPALPVTDTVKEVETRPAGEPEPVVGTPRRDRLRAVQTPQGFETSVLVAAHRTGAERAGDEALAASDDAGLVEACGGRVVVVAGDERAMKVTTPMDLALAELLLERQSAQGERPAGGCGEN